MNSLKQEHDVAAVTVVLTIKYNIPGIYPSFCLQGSSVVAAEVAVNSFQYGVGITSTGSEQFKGVSVFWQVDNFKHDLDCDVCLVYYTGT